MGAGPPIFHTGLETLESFCCPVTSLILHRVIVPSGPEGTSGSGKSTQSKVPRFQEHTEEHPGQTENRQEPGETSFISQDWRQPSWTPEPSVLLRPHSLS